MLEHILIKQFVNGLNNEVSRERVILREPKTLTEAAQFAPCQLSGSYATIPPSLRH